MNDPDAFKIAARALRTAPRRRRRRGRRMEGTVLLGGQGLDLDGRRCFGSTPISARVVLWGRRTWLRNDLDGDA